MSSEKKHEKEQAHGNENKEVPAEGKKNLKKWIIIGSVIALVLVIISAAVFFFFFKTKAGDKETPGHAKEEKKEKEEKPKEGEENKGEAEQKKPDEKSFYPAIFFSEKLTLPLKAPVKEGEEKVKKLTRKKEKEEEVKEGQYFLIIKVALEFENEEIKKAFEEQSSLFLKELGAVAATKNKDELLQFSEKLKLKLEMSRIAEKVTDGKARPKNIFFTDFTIQ